MGPGLARPAPGAGQQQRTTAAEIGGGGRSCNMVRTAATCNTSSKSGHSCMLPCSASLHGMNATDRSASRFACGGARLVVRAEFLAGMAGLTVLSESTLVSERCIVRHNTLRPVLTLRAQPNRPCLPKFQAGLPPQLPPHPGTSHVSFL